MVRFTLALGTISLFASLNGVIAWGQCGGQNYAGPITCTPGFTCVYSNIYFSTCQPATTGSNDGPLIPGYSWIRTVAYPDLYKYLHSSNQNAPGVALVGITTTASQFVVEGGQLKHYLPGGGFLYGVVEAKTQNANKLKVSFSTTPATSGKFEWRGEALRWTISTIPQTALTPWLTCDDYEGRALYINLIAPSYIPGGCHPHTIQYYRESIPNSE